MCMTGVMFFFQLDIFWISKRVIDFQHHISIPNGFSAYCLLTSYVAILRAREAERSGIAAENGAERVEN